MLLAGETDAPAGLRKALANANRLQDILFEEVRPGRTGGGGRRYSWRDIEQLREDAQLTATGIGLEGVKRNRAYNC